MSSAGAELGPKKYVVSYFRACSPADPGKDINLDQLVREVLCYRKLFAPTLAEEPSRESRSRLLEEFSAETIKKFESIYTNVTFAPEHYPSPFLPLVQEIDTSKTVRILTTEEAYATLTPQLEISAGVKSRVEAGSGTSPKHDDGEWHLLKAKELELAERDAEADEAGDEGVIEDTRENEKQVEQIRWLLAEVRNTLSRKSQKLFATDQTLSTELLRPIFLCSIPYKPLAIWEWIRLKIIYKKESASEVFSSLAEMLGDCLPSHLCVQLDIAIYCALEYLFLAAPFVETQSILYQALSRWESFYASLYASFKAPEAIGPAYEWGSGLTPSQRQTWLAWWFSVPVSKWRTHDSSTSESSNPQRRRRKNKSLVGWVSDVLQSKSAWLATTVGVTLFMVLTNRTPLGSIANLLVKDDDEEVAPP